LCIQPRSRCKSDGSQIDGSVVANIIGRRHPAGTVAVVVNLGRSNTIATGYTIHPGFCIVSGRDCTPIVSASAVATTEISREKVLVPIGSVVEGNTSLAFRVPDGRNSFIICHTHVIADPRLPGSTIPALDGHRIDQHVTMGREADLDATERAR